MRSTTSHVLISACTYIAEVLDFISVWDGSVALL